LTKKKRAEFSLSIRKKVIRRSRNRCERCFVDFDDDFKGQFHHIIPIVFGGDNSLENCSLLCKNCHDIAPNIKNKEEMIIYIDYFLRFASFKEAAQHYDVDNRYDLSIKSALDISKIFKKK
jgi:hypothetical protein